MLWLHLFIFSVTLQCLIYFGLPRYRYPVEPFCMLFAALTVSSVIAWFSPSRGGEAGPCQKMALGAV